MYDRGCHAGIERPVEGLCLNLGFNEIEWVGPAKKKALLSIRGIHRPGRNAKKSSGRRLRRGHNRNRAGKYARNSLMHRQGDRSILGSFGRRQISGQSHVCTHGGCLWIQRWSTAVQTVRGRLERNSHGQRNGTSASVKKDSHLVINRLGQFRREIHFSASSSAGSAEIVSPAGARIASMRREQPVTVTAKPSGAGISRRFRASARQTFKAPARGSISTPRTE